MKYTIFLRTDKPNKSGLHPVCLRIIINRKPKLYTLPIHVKKCDWSEVKTCVLRSDIQHANKNALILKSRQKADSVLEFALMNDIPLTLDDFDYQFKNRFEKTSFESFARQLIEERVNDYAPETIRSYKSYLTKLKQFRNELTFKDINTKLFIVSYEKYMKQTLKNDINTVWKSLSYFKSVLNEAKNRKLINHNAFEAHKLTKVQGKREYLTINELQSVENLMNSEVVTGKIKDALKCFLFACYTGIRLSDLKKLTYANIVKSDYENTENEIVSDLFIEYSPQKTKHSSNIGVKNLLIKKAVSLLDLSQTPETKIFRVLHGQNLNEYIRKLMDLVGITKHISIHCARHTFATMLCTKGVPIATISKLVGHTDARTTMIYAKIIDSSKVDAMRTLE